MPDHKPANLSAFSSFVTVPESENRLKHKKEKAITLVCLQTRKKADSAINAKIINLKARTDAVRAALKQRKLKFNATVMALEGYEHMLAKIEAELI